ncbi:MAG: hypothetical protein PWQ67_2571 [Clostridia bacterium]|jgi:hypothetical protein|nr:hypothetical protein [Clostridia bacterium]
MLLILVLEKRGVSFLHQVIFYLFLDFQSHMDNKNTLD